MLRSVIIPEGSLHLHLLQLSADLLLLGLQGFHDLDLTHAPFFHCLRVNHDNAHDVGIQRAGASLPGAKAP